MSFDPGEILREVDEGGDAIDQAASEHAEALTAEAYAEAAYDREFESQVLTIYHEAKRNGERLPAEDVRKAIAHDQMDDELYANHLMTKAQAAATEKTLRAVLARVSAKQSVLRALQGGG